MCSDLSGVVADGARAAARVDEAVLAVYAGLFELAADDLVDPEGRETKADVAQAALLRLIEDMRKVARVQAAGAKQSIQADADIPAASKQRVTETRIRAKHRTSTDTFFK
jgi:hypothetical protein